MGDLHAGKEQYVLPPPALAPRSLAPDVNRLAVALAAVAKAGLALEAQAAAASCAVEIFLTGDRCSAVASPTSPPAASPPLHAKSSLGMP
eukprot:6615614-Alexandrium_andersonii.AAC.1